MQSAMEPCRSLALLTSSLGLVSLLVALSTDFWFAAQGPKSSSHSGLWPSKDQVSVAGKAWGCGLGAGKSLRGRAVRGPISEQATSM